MRIFLTGATGFIGSAIAGELLAAGHQVVGLARDEEKAAMLTRRGIEVHRGDLLDTDGLVAGARACDGVIHTAFIHDFADMTNFVAAIETDRRAVEAMTSALEGTGKPFVLSSGLAMIAPGRVATEEDAHPTGNTAYKRGETEVAALATAARGVRVSVIRLPPTVHGAGEKGFVPMIIDVARGTGVAAYVGDGANRWCAVHRLDAARLYLLALEHAAPGTRLHAVAEEGVPMRAIAQTIGAGLNLPTRSLSAEEAAPHFGWMAGFVGLDTPASSAITREAFNWRPQGPELLADMRDNGYFAQSPA